MSEVGTQAIKATVIMAAYNTEEYIEEAIDSILQQSYTNFELLIIEDASTDNTLEVIKKYTDPRISILKNEENLGQTKCLNIGIREAVGKYILIMDSDDIAHQDRLKIQIEFMEQNPEIVWSGSWMREFGKKNYVVQPVTEHDEIRAQLVLGNIISNTTFIIRKSVLDTYGIQYNESIRHAQDYFFIEEMSTYGKIAIIPKVLMKYRTHDKQVSIAKKEEQDRWAGVTLKRILKDLHITLSETEFELWLKFCFARLGNVSGEEMQVVTNIVRLIEKNNEELHLYNQEMLSKVLKNRLAFPNVSAQNSNVDDKLFLQIDILEKWLKKKIEGYNLSDYFVKRNCKTIAIYGMAVLGKRLVDELESTDIEVKYFLDNNKGSHYKKLERKDIDYQINDVDAVIVTPIQCFDQICKGLNVSNNVQMISMQDVVYDIW